MDRVEKRQPTELGRPSHSTEAHVNKDRAATAPHPLGVRACHECGHPTLLCEPFMLRYEIHGPPLAGLFLMVLFFVLYGCHRRFLFPGIVDCDGRGRRKRRPPGINMKLMTIGPPPMNNTPSAPPSSPPLPPLSHSSSSPQCTTASCASKRKCLQTFLRVRWCVLQRNSSLSKEWPPRCLGRKKIAETRRRPLTSTNRWLRNLRSVSCLLAFLGHAFRSARRSLSLDGLWNHGRS